MGAIAGFFATVILTIIFGGLILAFFHITFESVSQDCHEDNDDYEK